MSLEKIAQRSVATVSKGESLEEAAKRMRNAHVGDLVVIERRGHSKTPVGMITDRDIVVSTVAVGIDPKDFIVDDVMSRNVVTATMQDDLSSVLSLMKENGFRRIPIVDGEGSLAGIVAAEDVIGHLVGEFASIAAITKRQKKAERKNRRKYA